MSWLFFFLGVAALLIGLGVVSICAAAMMLDGVEATFANPSETKMLGIGAAVMLVGILLLYFG